jgi:hypothetical protein
MGLENGAVPQRRPLIWMQYLPHGGMDVVGAERQVAALIRQPIARAFVDEPVTFVEVSSREDGLDSFTLMAGLADKTVHDLRGVDHAPADRCSDGGNHRQHLARPIWGEHYFRLAAP